MVGEEEGQDVTEGTPILAVDGAVKRFGGVTALEGVSLELRPGEVHALCGQNGAGKSTLIKILGGAIQPDSGSILLRGEPVTLGTPAASLDAGIRIIYQDFHLVPELDAAENVFLGQEVSRYGFLERRRMYARTRELLAAIGGEGTDPGRPVGELRTGEQQIVEIAKALNGEAQILIMDEPTASLTQLEKDRLFRMVEKLKGRGIAMLFVSHQLDEIFRVADRITTIRDGRVVGSVARGETTPLEVSYMMLGKAVDAPPKDRAHGTGSELLRLEGLTRRGAFTDISLTVHSGEVVGLVGPIGSGRTEIVRSIFGLDPFDEGRILMDGKSIRFRSPEQAVRAGIAFVPEDRKSQGLVLGRPILHNFSLVALRRFAGRFGWIRRRRELTRATSLSGALKLKSRSLHDPVDDLSGGNQQKIVLGKWLMSEARIFLMDEPTHGVDIEAKGEIRRLINDICQQGGAVLLISSDLDEVLELMDRVLVLRKGLVIQGFGRGADRDHILQCLLSPIEEGTAVT